MGVALRGPLVPRAGPLGRLAHVLLGAAALCGLAQGSYIEAADVEVSNMATTRMDEFCADVDLDSIDKEAGRESLRSAVGDENIFLDSLKEANNSDELSTKFEEKLDAEWIGGTVGPIVMSIVMAALWWFFCWTACPCCKCCRCCAQQRKRSKPCKLFVLLIVALLGAAMIVSVFMALTGLGYIEEGMDATTCTAAQVVEYTLNGNTGANFLGMLPMLNNLSTMKQVLADDSQFINDVFTILNATVDVDRSSYLATQSLQLFSDTLSLSANMNPAVSLDSTGQYHTCQLCTALATPLSALATALSDSSAAALASVYTEVETQLGPESRASLRDAFDGGVTPLRDSATMIRDSFKPLLEDDFKDLKELVIFAIFIFVLVFSTGVILIAACGCTSGLMCSFCEYREKQDEAGEELNPWNKQIAPCACCSWCCGWGYAVVVLFVGGIMIVLSVVMSSVCLPMDELSGQLMDDIMPALDVTSTGDDLVMMKDMIDGCFSQLNQEDAVLMEIMFTRENGTKVNMSAKIKGQSTDLMKEKFATLDNKLATGEKMMDNADLISLLSTIANNPVDTLMVFNWALLSGSPYQSIYAAPGTVADGAGSSLACSDSVFDGSTIYGLNSLLTDMADFDGDGTLISTGTCTGTADCTVQPVDSQGQSLCNSPANCPAACAAANDLMALKAQLISATTYRCDIFQDENGNDCDVLNMGGDAANGYTNDCLAAGASSVTRLQKTCTLAEFTTYVQDWETRLRNVFQRVDDVLEEKQDEISVNLRLLVDEYITEPVEGIVAGSSCQFLKTAYGDLVSGMCFKGAMGFRYIALSYSWNGVLTAMLILMTYAIWRHSVDNRNKWRDDKKAREAGLMGGGDGDAWASTAGTPVVPIDDGKKPAAQPEPLEDNDAVAKNPEPQSQQEPAEIPGTTGDSAALT
jgi:hypothetical protein